MNYGYRVIDRQMVEEERGWTTRVEPRSRKQIDCKRERERERRTRLVVTRAKDARIQRRKDQQLAMPSEKGYRNRNQPPGSSQTTSSSPNSPQFQWSDKRSDTELVVDEQAYHYTYQLVTCMVCASGAENLDRDAGRAPNAAAASFPFSRFGE